MFFFVLWGGGGIVVDLKRGHKGIPTPILPEADCVCWFVG